MKIDKVRKPLSDKYRLSHCALRFNHRHQTRIPNVALMLLLLLCELLLIHSSSAAQPLTDEPKKQIDPSGLEYLAQARRMLVEQRPVSALLLAGRAVGFASLGGPFPNYQSLLRPDSKEFGDALDLIRETPFPMVWQSPSLHHAKIRFLDFSHDGTILASASGRIAHLWDVKEGNEIATITAKGGLIHSLKFTRDGYLVLAVGEDFASLAQKTGSLEFWNLKSLRLATTIPVAHGALNGLTAGDNGHLLSTYGREFIHVWNVTEKKKRVTFKVFPFEPQSVALSPDGTSLAAVGWEKSIKIWDIKQEKEIANLSPTIGILRTYRPGSNIAYSPDGRFLAASIDSEVNIWNVKTGKLVRGILGHHKITFTHDAQLLTVSIDDDAIRFWNVDTGEVVTTLNGQWETVENLVLSPDNKIVASVVGWNNIIRLWNIPEKREFPTAPAHRGYIDSVAFSPAGDLIASSGDYDGTVRLWSSTSGDHLHTLRRNDDGAVRGLSFDNGGELIVAAGGHDHGAVLWNVHSGQLIGPLGGTSSSWSTDFSPKAQYVAIGYTGAIEVYDANNRKRITRLEAHPGSIVESVAYSPDGKLIASAGRDKIINIWAPDRTLPLQTLRGHHGYVNDVVFERNGQAIWSCSDDGTIRLWDISTGTTLLTLSGGNIPIKALDLSPGGELLISAHTDKTIRLWDLQTGKLKYILEGHSDPVTSVAFDHDGRHIVSSSGRTLVIWDLSGQQRQISENYLQQIKFIGNQVTFSHPEKNLYGSPGIFFPQ